MKTFMLSGVLLKGDLILPASQAVVAESLFTACLKLLDLHPKMMVLDSNYPATEKDIADFGYTLHHDLARGNWCYRDREGDVYRVYKDKQQALNRAQKKCLMDFYLDHPILDVNKLNLSASMIAPSRRDYVGVNIEFSTQEQGVYKACELDEAKFLTLRGVQSIDECSRIDDGLHTFIVSPKVAKSCLGYFALSAANQLSHQFGAIIDNVH